MICPVCGMCIKERKYTHARNRRHLKALIKLFKEKKPVVK